MKTWPIKKLVEITERLNLEKAVVGSWPYIEIGDIDLENKSISFKDKKSIKGAVVAPENTVLISRVRPTRGAIVLIDKSYPVSSAFTILKARQSETSSRFLFYWLSNFKSLSIYLQSRQKGSNYPSVREKDILNFEITLPPLEIQKQIVERLDKIAEARKLNDELIQKTDELFQSFLHKELNSSGREWAIKRLPEVSKLERGKFTPRPRNDPIYFGGSIPWIQTGEIVNSDGFIRTYHQTLNEEGLKVSKIFFKGTIVITIAANIGDLAILEIDAAFPDSIVGIRADKDLIDNKFLYFQLLLSKNYLNSVATQAAQKNINLAILSKVKIVLPTLKIQKQIVAKLSAVQDYKKQLLEQKLKLKELFDSVLTKSMKG